MSGAMELAGSPYRALKLGSCEISSIGFLLESGGFVRVTQPYLGCCIFGTQIRGLLEGGDSFVVTPQIHGGNAKTILSLDQFGIKSDRPLEGGRSFFVSIHSLQHQSPSRPTGDIVRIHLN